MMDGGVVTQVAHPMSGPDTDPVTTWLQGGNESAIIAFRAAARFDLGDAVIAEALALPEPQQYSFLNALMYEQVFGEGGRRWLSASEAITFAEQTKVLGSMNEGDDD